MKYIRTRDGRIFNLIAYKEDGEINGGIKYTSKLNGSYFFIQKDNILKQADTIEELFDEYVYANKEKDIKCFCLLHQPITTIYYGAKLEDIETKKLINDKNVEVYGAIWTDKGLIYKARMKGILPNGEIDWELL